MTKNTKDILSILSLLVFALVLIVVGPLAILWSLNTLFPVLAIPYNFYTWAAVVIMNLTWMGKSALKRS